MTNTTTTSSLALVPNLKMAWQDVHSSFERFCLTAGIGAIEQMLCEDAQRHCHSNTLAWYGRAV